MDQIMTWIRTFDNFIEMEQFIGRVILFNLMNYANANDPM